MVHGVVSLVNVQSSVFNALSMLLSARSRQRLNHGKVSSEDTCCLWDTFYFTLEIMSFFEPQLVFCILEFMAEVGGTQHVLGQGFTENDFYFFLKKSWRKKKKKGEGGCELTK